MGDRVDYEGETDAVEDVVEENLCGWPIVFVFSNGVDIMATGKADVFS